MTTRRRHWIRRRRWALPVVRAASGLGRLSDPPAAELERALGLPRFLCLTERSAAERADVLCVEVGTGRSFAVECGLTWARVYVATHRPGSRSTVRAGVLADRWLGILVAGREEGEAA